MRNSLHRLQSPITFVNGCFDLLHSGHVRLLNFAASQSVRYSLGRDAGLLVVGLNSNESVYRNKGAGRPVMNWAERARLLLALETVDAVVGFDEDTASELVADLKPTLYVKGGDYKDKIVPEVLYLPGTSSVLFCPRCEIELIDMSSTKVIARVIDAERTRVASDPNVYSPLKAAVAELAGTRDQADRP